MKQKLKFGIIGCGAVAQIIHLPILKKNQLIEISAICDLDERKLLSVAEKFHIEKTYTDLQKFFDENEFDAIMILTPTNTHKEIAETASNYCKNIFIEKPITRNHKETKELQHSIKKNHANVMIGFHMRFRPDSMLMKSLIEAKEFGDLYLVKAGWFRPRSSMQNWFVKKTYSGGGVLMDLGLSIIDLAMWMLNYPEVFSVKAHNFFITTKDVEDVSVILIKTKKGHVISMEVSWLLSNESEWFYFNLFGSDGSVFLNPLRVKKQVGNSHVNLLDQSRSVTSNLYLKAYENQIKHFVAAINGVGKWVSTIDEALSRQALLEAIYKSAKLNKEIKF